ncbi:MAG TPA: hypothetical protein VKS21_08135, partial [Spirochaetota bacterium]|nr:hypothetical protein [Spirochaetota bacterium]
EDSAGGNAAGGNTVLFPSSLVYDGSVNNAVISTATLFGDIDPSDITQCWIIINNAGTDTPTSGDLTVQVDNLKFTDGSADAMVFDGGTDNLGPVWDTTPSISTSKVPLGDL